MSSRKVWWNGDWVDLSDGGGTNPAFPGASLADNALPSSWGAVTATGSSTPYQPGAWVEIDASLSADAGGIALSLNAATNTAGTDTSTLLQIGTGTASSETPWATFSVGYMSVNTTLLIPGFIASGARVAARVLSAAQANKQVAARYIFLSSQGVTGAPQSYGPNTTNARGTTVSYPGTINTMSGWVEATASTTADINVLAVTVSGGSATAIGNNVLSRVDIGVGAAASETVVCSVGMRASNTNENLVYVSPNLFGVTIPAGSRIAVRYSTDDASQSAIDVSLVGA